MNADGSRKGFKVGSIVSNDWQIVSY